MTTLTTQAAKGTTLTKAEADANFELNSVAKSVNYSILVSDNRTFIHSSQAITLSLPDAASTIASSDTGDFEVWIKNASFAGGNSLTIDLATATDNIDGSVNDSDILLPGQTECYKLAAAGTTYYRKLNTNRSSSSSTAINVNTGTSVTLDSAVPSWAKKITISVYAMEFSVSANCYLQIGDFSGYSTSGYVSKAQKINSSPTTSLLTNGFLVTDSLPSITIPYTGIITLVKAFSTSNEWICTVDLAEEGTNNNIMGVGRLSLVSPLTQIKIISGGFDGSGQVGLLYEP